MSASVVGRILGLALAMAVVLSFGVASVESAIPNNGTYYACLTKKTGAVKVINYPKQQCPKGTRLIKWNARGPAGPQGPQGAQGAKGDQGAPGPADWNAIPNKPAGFADGVDNVGYASAIQGTYNLAAYTGPGTGFALVYADVPLGVDVELYIIPAVGASMIAWEEGMERGPRATSAYEPLLPAVPADTVRRVYYVENNDATATTFKVRIRAYDTGIAPAALKKVAKQVKVGVVKVPKRAANSLLRRIGR